jgi:hypothetical protein
VDDVLTLSRPEAREGRTRLVPALVVALILAVVLVVAMLALRTPDTVSLTVDNPHPWRTEVSIRPAESESWTGLGAVSRDADLTFLEVADQGTDWVVRFSYADVTEEVAITRDDLAAQDWTIEVPASLAAKLEAEGVKETTGSTAG